MPPTALQANHLAQRAAAFDLFDDELSDAADRAAASVRRRIEHWNDLGAPEAAMRRGLLRIAQQSHVQPPTKPGLQEALNRFSDAAWWRRALRKRFRAVEHAAIVAGQVHKHASPYVSERALKRAARDRRRVSDLLASLDCINQSTGEVRPLSELAANSLANPANRRKAMMARIKGIEEHAKALGYEALFFTITCPSRMHARHRSGARNERYEGADPRHAQVYLNRVWRRAMRKAQHEGVSTCGLRVVEPHHDGCPHWHVLAFVAPAQAEALIQTVRNYALCDSGNEPGATAHRFKFERIDPAKGSAVGYVAKYVSKSIDGKGVESDDETGEGGADSALRIVSWARHWGIRQFQFFGVPAITPTRELYRLDRLDFSSPGLQAAHEASRANDYGAWLRAIDVHALRFSIDYSERPSSRYAGETARRICGVTARASDLASAVQLTTRTDEWRVEPRRREVDGAGFSPPWTRFNNCAPVDSIEVFGQKPGRRSSAPADLVDDDDASWLDDDWRPPPVPRESPSGGLPC